MQFAQLDTSQPDAPVATAFRDVYFSRSGGAAETRHVFLQGNGLPERWQTHPLPWFSVGETGFGTGLNFLVTWQAMRQHGKGLRLHFVSTERFPIHPRQLPDLLLPLSTELPVINEFLTAWHDLVPGWNRFSFSDAELTLWIGDATEGLLDCQADIDAWYLDGFAPDRNPELWHPDLFHALGRLSHRDTTVATYTVARAVREGLTAAGFQVSKRPGFGRKRHCLGGRFAGLLGPVSSRSRHWRWPRPVAHTPESVAIIGSGLAAAELAHRLRRRDLCVTVIGPDAPEHPFPDAVQGAVYARPGLEADPATCWYAAALSYRLRLWSSEGHGWPGARTGLLQMLPQDRWQRLCAVLNEHPFGQCVQPMTADQATDKAGIPLHSPALWFAGSGWLSPGRYSRLLLGDTPTLKRRIVSLAPHPDGWQLTNDQDEQHLFSTVVIAAGMASRSWPISAHLPLRPVRGQLTGVSSADGPDCVICAERYVTPAGPDGQWHFGATFQPRDGADDIRPEDRDENLAALAQLSPELAQRAAQNPLSDAAGVRATTPDYLPLAGPLLTAEARARRATPRQALRADLFHQGLFVLSGLGSKGLASAPLLAEYVACQITGEPLPFGHSLEQRIHAERHWLK
ncbi:MAG: FAD-dependent 5-carboxymethylaminomethyl-2-thiouridine(34) oxidoreductase MnmC [Natronospirillum sp.]|uniref:FAD-dependent 5-carboxymethylaminomethyl-2-thiouridine(34) oxidoreductase MnmC n=1 Tax=Natronospirillum sp. TaxID=2812955 RepID=UPI0025F7E413|nr:FAD-dependent 5-carboxymethylaminomethyl-2-thiouridine(34) oxidoreductase MnmC [Natronospirillum sp.]MCH8551855.1 FAD-dependent 5-carboxymethylaminomethyl-2-thiouridine(34) oxidoreductase MnmC [Natronospirillum sp.]